VRQKYIFICLYALRAGKSAEDSPNAWDDEGLFQKILTAAKYFFLV
jgi:hypothetical protein